MLKNLIFKLLANLHKKNEPHRFTYNLDFLLFFLFEKWKGFFMCLKL